jgi:hypothetical protein
MNYTDKQLKTALEMMLPDLIFNCGDLYIYDAEFGSGGHRLVSDTELLHICWLVEETLTNSEVASYSDGLESAETRWWSPFHASWQQRVVELAKVKGIEI